MSPRRTLAIVGILVIIIPFLGVPSVVRTTLLLVLGVFVIAYAGVLHVRYFSPANPQTPKDNQSTWYEG